MRRRAARLRWLLPLLALCGCAGGPGYLARLGWNEARILWRREPIAELLARPDLDATLRERLTLVLAVRDFGRDRLGLRVGDSYTTYATVGDDARIWVVSAAHRDRLEPYTWWYPIAGRVPYRGFFDRAAADATAAAMAGENLDTDVRSAIAFSTLGWFADPLLSSTAASPPVELAETVLHETFHATRYVPGASSFNESAAMFVGHRGAIAYFCGPGAAPESCATARRRWTLMKARGRVLGRLAVRLRALYAAALPPAVREARRAALCRQAAASLTRRRLGRTDDLVPPNNARLLSELIYFDHLDDFDRLAADDATLPGAIARLVAAPVATDDPFAWLPR